METHSGSSATRPSSARSPLQRYGWHAACSALACGIIFGVSYFAANRSSPSSPAFPADITSPLAECRRKLAENLGHVFATERAVYGHLPPAGKDQTIEVAARVGSISCSARLALDETWTGDNTDGVSEGGK